MAIQYQNLGFTSEDLPFTDPLIAGGFPRAELAVTIAQGAPALKRGTIIGKVTSSGLYRRLTRAAVMTGGAFATDSATGKVSGADEIFVAGDVLKNAAGTTVGTVLSVTDDTITLTANAAVAVAVGAEIYANDGTGAALGVLGIDTVAAADGDIPAFMYTTGEFNKALLVGYTATAHAELEARNIYAKEVAK